MDSSHIFGATEECHSCESGWTMYIGSPIDGDDDNDEQSSDHGDNADDDEGKGNDDEDDGKNYGHEDDSDDSMASDASSGPSHQGMAHYKHEGDGNKYHLQRKAKKTILEKKQKAEKQKDEKEEMVLVDKTTSNAPSQSGSKVRKSFWMGKRK